MNKQIDWKKETVLVIGTGISGIGAARLLLEAGARVLVLDQNPDTDREKVLSNFREGERPELYLGRLPAEAERTVTRAVPSPGVPMDSPALQGIRAEGKPVISEVELAFCFEKGTLLAVTGTNGKTTTTSLVGAIMQDHAARRGTKAFIVGNIGRSYAQAVRETDPSTFSVGEISSFHLEAVDTFHPHVCAITNITPDHLDRHKTMEAYIAAKKQICKNQTAGDFCVLNYEDPVLRKFGLEECPASVIWFSSKRMLPDGYCLRDGVIFRTSGGREQALLSMKEVRLVGNCNAENIMTAIAVCEAAGVPFDEMLPVIRSFPPVEHRIEYVGEAGGTAYFNDSKATNPDAAIQGIRAMECPVWLIAGGYDKNSDYSDWIRNFDGKVKGMALIGATARAIAECAEDLGFPGEKIAFFDTFEDAFAFCADHAGPGEAVLLSPACASWGMFKNYEERGRRFKELAAERGCAAEICRD